MVRLFFGSPASFTRHAEPLNLVQVKRVNKGQHSERVESHQKIRMDSLRHRLYLASQLQIRMVGLSFGLPARFTRHAETLNLVQV